MTGPRMLAYLFLCALTGCAVDHVRVAPAETFVRASSASLAIDGDALFFVDRAREAVMRASRDGVAVPIAPAHPSLYDPIALTRRDVVWGDRDGSEVRVMRVPRSGGAPMWIGGGNGGPIGIGVDGDHVYFARDRGTFELVDADLASGTEHVVAPDMAALGIAIDGDDLLVARCAAGGILRVPRDGRAIEPVGDAYCPIAIVLDGDAIYFTDYGWPDDPGRGGFAIFRVEASGSVPQRVTFADGIVFTVHRGEVFTAHDGRIVRVASDGTERALADCADVRGIAVDDARVFWTTPSADGALDLRSTPRD